MAWLDGGRWMETARTAAAMEITASSTIRPRLLQRIREESNKKLHLRAVWKGIGNDMPRSDGYSKSIGLSSEEMSNQRSNIL